MDLLPSETPLGRFRGLLDRAAISPDKPLYAVMLSLFMASQRVPEETVAALSPIADRMAAAAAGMEAAADRIATDRATLAKEDLKDLAEASGLRMITDTDIHRLNTHAVDFMDARLRMRIIVNRFGIAICVAFSLAFGAACAGAGYWQGSKKYDDGYAAGSAVGLHANAVMGKMPENEAAAWAKLIADNPAIVASIAQCKPDAQPQSGRMACALEVWLEPQRPPQN
jgi:hypothetical protein